MTQVEFRCSLSQATTPSPHLWEHTVASRHAFELLHRLGTEQLYVDGSHDTVDAWVVRKERALTALLTNHALPRHATKTEQERITLTDAPKSCSASVERIDRAHANAIRLWRESGGPDYLSVAEVEHFQEASRIVQEPQHCELANGTLSLDIALPPQAVAAITIDFAAEPAGRGGQA